MANIFIPSFVDLPADVFPYIFKYLDVEDLIAFALTCQIFRQIFVRNAKIFRKMDFSRRGISTTQRREINTFFRDRQLTQHVTELNISNLRALNWQMDDHLEELIMSICLQLEALYALNCGMSFQRLHRILKEAPKLRALSWSLWGFTAEDIEFVLKSTESSDGICFKNIEYLRLEMNGSLSHIQIAKYLVLFSCRDLKELEIYIWDINEAHCTGWNFPLAADQMIPGFPQPSVETELQHLHSLMVVPVGFLCFRHRSTHTEILSDFIVSVVRSKSSSTKWKKLWISPSISIWHLADFSRLHHQVGFQSVEAVAANPGWSANAVDELKCFFERIGGNTIRSLHMTELGLLSHCFENGICEHLSELKHLTKVQLRQCAISSKYNRRNQVELSESNLWTFVENCKNLTHLDVRDCFYHVYFSSSGELTDGDLLALANLRKLKSLTLYRIIEIREWTFLKNILDNCKFLTTVRISDFNDSFIPIFLESSRFLKHLAVSVDVSVLGSEVFWNLLIRAKNLQRLCIRCGYSGSLNVPFAVETLKSLPRLHVLHLHSENVENVDDFYDQMMRMLEEKESACKFSFEIITRNRKITWINHETGHSLISKKVLPLNEAELCDMIPILDIPRF